jgi:nucleoside-diphosphate-sugar epimerase
MRVFVTGASGWIGSAVVPELLGAGHEVVGLARSDASAAALSAAGAEVERGDLDDLDALRRRAEAADGVIHLAFKHEIAFSGDFEGAAAADRRAVEALAEGLDGSDRPLVVASGVMGLRAGSVVTEQDGHGASAPSLAAPGPRARWATGEFTLSLAGRGIRSSIVRLAPTNHGDGDNGFLASIVAVAAEKGVSGYIGDGTNRWAAVHRLDSARLFRLAVENAPAGSTLHAIADEGVPIRDIAEVIGRQLGVPVASVPQEQAAEHFGWLAAFLGIDGPASSAITRERLGWEPTQLGLIADLEQGHYVRAARQAAA